MAPTYETTYFHNLKDQITNSGQGQHGGWRSNSSVPKVKKKKKLYNHNRASNGTETEHEQGVRFGITQ